MADISEQLKQERIKNFRERIWFVKYWANFVKNSQDSKWSEGQNKLINSQVSSSREFYKKLKNEMSPEEFDRIIKDKILKNINV